MFRSISIFSCVVGCLSCGMVMAKDTLRGNAGVDYSQINYKGDYFDKIYNEKIFATVYLPAVSKEDHPWKEASFLQHASTISVSAISAQTSTDYGDTYHGAGLSLGGNYASRTHSLVLGASLFHRDDDMGNYNVKYDSYTFSAGSYLGKSTLLSLDYNISKQKETISGFGTDNTESLGLNSKFLFEYAGGTAFGMFINATYLRSKPDQQSPYNEKSVQLSPEFYFNQTTSITFNYYQRFGATNSFKGLRTYELTLHKFIGQMFAFYAALKKYDYLGTNIVSAPENSFELRGELWF